MRWVGWQEGHPARKTGAKLNETRTTQGREHARAYSNIAVKL